MTAPMTREELLAVDALAKLIWLAGFERAFDRHPVDPWKNQSDTVKHPHLDTARKILAAGYVMNGRAQSAPSDPDHLASSLVVAWSTYVTTFGEPPHGTKKQMRALLQLMPAAPQSSWQPIETAPKDQEVEVRGIWKLRGDGVVFTHWRPAP